MARKPNYDFERREREKAKAAKVAERIKSKMKPTDGDPAEGGTSSDTPAVLPDPK